MDILALTHRRPFPPDRGDRVRSWHLLSRLARDHRVWLLSVDDAPADGAVERVLEETFYRHRVIPISPLRRLIGAAGCMLTGRPLTLGWFHTLRLERQMRRWTREVEFDAAFVYSSAMAPYWMSEHERTGLPGVLDFIDVDSRKWEQYATHFHGPRRWIYNRESRKLAEYEREIEQVFSSSVFVSEAEVEIFSGFAPQSRARALPLGVDRDVLGRPELVREADPPHIVFTGQMDYYANIDAVSWFVAEVFPLVREQVPGTCFDIVGSRPTDEVTALESVPGVHVTGWVETVTAWLWQASVAVAPMRIAQGTQNKVLEAMAASLPVVLTTRAARGLAEADGPHLRVHDEPAAIASAIVELLKDHNLRDEQVRAGHAFLDRHHNWEVAAGILEELVESAARRGPM